MLTLLLILLLASLLQEFCFSTMVAQCHVGVDSREQRLSTRRTMNFMLHQKAPESLSESKASF